MRLFGKVNGLIDRFDRGDWFDDGFDAQLLDAPASKVSRVVWRMSAAGTVVRRPSTESSTASRGGDNYEMPLCLETMSLSQLESLTLAELEVLVLTYGFAL